MNAISLTDEDIKYTHYQYKLNLPKSSSILEVSAEASDLER